MANIARSTLKAVLLASLMTLLIDGLVLAQGKQSIQTLSSALTAIQDEPRSLISENVRGMRITLSSGQHSMLHRVAIIGDDGRVRSRRSNYTESIGRVHCYASREAKLRGEGLLGNGTATIVAPLNQNHDRNFETVTTAAHVLYGPSGNERRYCLFKPLGGQGEGEFEIKGQTPLPYVDLTSIGYQDRDFAIGVIETRLTQCEAEACRINSSGASSRTAKPIHMFVLEEDNYEALKATGLEYQVRG